MQGPHPLCRLVGEEPGSSNNFVQLQVKVTEIGPHQVPVGLLSLQVQLNEVGEHHLQVAGKGGRCFHHFPPVRCISGC
jgi:hypothetical protein